MLSNLITPDSIKINLESTDREECFAELLEVIAAKQPQLNRKEALEALINRESKLSTAIVKYAAVPHALCKSINNAAVAVGISKLGIEFEPVNPEDSQKNNVYIIFEILFEERDTEFHINILKDLLQLVNNPTFIEKAVNAASSLEVFDLISSLE